METVTLYERKGQVQGAVTSIILLIVGASVATMILIFSGALGGQVYEKVEDDIIALANRSVTNASHVLDNGTLISTGHPYIQAATLMILDENGTNVTSSTVFTMDLAQGTFLPIKFGMENTTCNFSYNYGNLTIRDGIQRGIISGFEAFEDTGDYLSIVILAVIITVVLGLVLGLLAVTNMGFGGGGRGTAL